MKVKKIHIENYRMLKRIDIDLEENLSLIIGKNNCGKTSLLELINEPDNVIKSPTPGEIYSNEFENGIQYKEYVRISNGESKKAGYPNTE